LKGIAVGNGATFASEVPGLNIADDK